MKENTIYRKIVRWSAVYDVLMTSAFGIPLILSWQLDLLQGLHKTLGLGGAFPVFEPAHLLFVGLLGSIVTVWSILRIRNPRAAIWVVRLRGEVPLFPPYATRPPSR
jgi:hypothetical protein